jgi:hypothetical protein
VLVPGLVDVNAFERQFVRLAEQSVCGFAVVFLAFSPSEPHSYPFVNSNGARGFVTPSQQNSGLTIESCSIQFNSAIGFAP